MAFAGRLGAAYQANLHLRTASRVLLRLCDFRVRRFADLERHARNLAWEVFLPPAVPLKVGVSLSESNLAHAGRVAEAVALAAAERLASLGIAPCRPAEAGEADVQTVLVRGVDRRATISLDTSGAHLHRRGYRLASGKAPLRENLAAALLLFAGYDGSEPLVDAMCGAGTLAIEAGLLARGIPPGRRRDFACLAWPAHREATWRHLLAEVDRALLSRPANPILARDLEGAALRLARENADRAGLVPAIAFERSDFFSAPPPPGPPGLLVANPPYGHRLGSVRQARALLERLGGRLRQAYGGWRVALVLYQPEWAEFLGLEEMASLAVPFGGLKVSFLRGRVA